MKENFSVSSSEDALLAPQSFSIVTASPTILRRRKLPEEEANRKMQNLQSCKGEFEVNFALSYCSSELTFNQQPAAQLWEWCEANKNLSLRNFPFGLFYAARRRGNHWNIFYNQRKVNCFVNMRRMAEVSSRDLLRADSRRRSRSRLKLLARTQPWEKRNGNFQLDLSFAR